MNRKLEFVGEQAVEAGPMVWASTQRSSQTHCIGSWTKAISKIDHQC